MRILTAGISVLEREKFKDRSYDFDKAYYLNKPRGFLWGSTLVKREGGKAYSSWMDFVEGSQYRPRKYSKGISYTLHKSAKIYTVSCVEDYLDLLDKYSLEVIEYEDHTNTLSRAYIDFGKLSEDYDAFHLTEDAFWIMRLPFEQIYTRNTHKLVADFYNYDCETWIIFNYDVINQGSIINCCIPIEIEEEEEEE